jgi:DNA adenine methylase
MGRGKTPVASALNNRLPDDWNDLYEPFFGGGAFFISLQNPSRISRALIADLNSELVSFYRVVKICPEKLIDTYPMTTLRIRLRPPSS